MPVTTGEGLQYHKGSKRPYQVEVQHEGASYKPKKHYPYHCPRPHCSEKNQACKRVSCQQLLQARYEQQEQSLSEAALDHEAIVKEKTAALTEYIRLRKEGETLQASFNDLDLEDEDEEERTEAEREKRIDFLLRETTLSSTEPEEDFDTGFARTQTYRGHGAGTMKPAGRRLNSNQPNTSNGNGGKMGKKAKRPALGY
ncbi:hypothetical protein DOTSEDRAFT_21988 [Dothistroma septosporum NZE10]|uniref:Uncharacterized protein n=1 Tax=Dothistroma septosporum (strain NZE10 / CBS 128990) TaxID=675120 RepID=N1PZ64_DOTSN|nr:hypothetical protein DOTSEDRAFT_21988 [Dothistroma septosporum NZE10]